MHSVCLLVGKSTFKMTDIIWDRRQLYVYEQTEKSRFDMINAKYIDFMNILNDVSKPPIKVFDGLSKRQSEELELIREVSKTLQKKKDDDIKKQAAAAESVNEEKEKPAETEIKEEETEKSEKTEA